MRRATDSAEQAFGSDSFLDIIANIVGILIILIVLAGLRVSQFPVSAIEEGVVADLASNIRADTADVELELSNSELPIDEVILDPIKELTPPPIPQTFDLTQLVTIEPRPSQELKEQYRLLGEEVESLRKSLASIGVEQSAAENEKRSLEEKLAAASDRLKQGGQSSAIGQEQVLQLTKSIEALKTEIAKFEQELKIVDNQRPPTEEIEHRVTQISHEITGKEVHFRLLENRVAQVPIQKLIERLRPEIERNRNWLARYGRQRGTVGPVDGFSMKYIVAKQRLSAIEELTLGQGAVRIGISEWSIDAEPDLEAETGEEALRQGSRFVGDLMMAEAEATLTFWVYPDSFEIYRKLQKAARQHGFTVAARPLPYGIPIAGSPNGSRSAGQ